MSSSDDEIVGIRLDSDFFIKLLSENKIVLEKF